MFAAMAFSIICLSSINDPALGSIKCRGITSGQFTSAHYFPPSLFTPPVLNLTLSAGLDSVVAVINPDQPLYEGWTDTNFCSNHSTWNYWWLNTRLGIDGLDSIYVLVSLYNYSNSNPDFLRVVLNNSGSKIREDAQWNGYHSQPIVKDGFGDNHYIGHPVLGWFDNMDAGVIDNLNNIATTKTDSALNIRFTKLDSLGNIIIDQIPVATGDTGQSWAGDTHLAINAFGIYYAVWSRNMREIVYARSTDSGLTWLAPVIIATDYTNQVNKPEIVIGPDNCVHFIWQHWDGNHNYLMYKKLDQNNVCIVDTSNLTPNAPVEVWAPEMAIDQDTNLHIVWSHSYQGSENLYHTVINGRCNNNGYPLPDSVLTIVQEYIFYSNALLKRYPKVILDSLDCLQVIFDQGAYGLNTDKQVYHLKKTLSARGYAIFPDSSKHEIILNNNRAAFDAPMIGTYFVKVWAWNSNGETGWDTASTYFSEVAENKYNQTFEVVITPTITKDRINIHCNQSKIIDANIRLFDVMGRHLKKIPIMTNNNSYILSLKDLPAGVYYLQIQNGNRQVRQRIVYIK